MHQGTPSPEKRFGNHSNASVDQVRQTMLSILSTGNMDASKWYEAWRKTDMAWSTLLNILDANAKLLLTNQPVHEYAPAECLLAAQSLVFKICRGPVLPDPRVPRLEGQDAHHTPPDQRQHSSQFGQHVLTTLLRLTQEFSSQYSTYGSLIKQLCLCLSSALGRWEGVLDFQTGFKSIVDALSSVGSGFSALSFVTLLPERCLVCKNIGLSPTRRSNLKLYLVQEFPKVHNLLVETIQKNPNLTLQVFECCNAWVEAACVDSQSLQGSPLINAACAFLGRHGMAANTALGVVAGLLCEEDFVRLCTEVRNFLLACTTLAYLGETPLALETGPCRNLTKKGKCEYMNACRYSHVLASGFHTPTPTPASIDPVLAKAVESGRKERGRNSRAQKKVAKVYSITSLPIQPFAAPELLQQIMSELHGLCTSVPTSIGATTRHYEIMSESIATLFTDIGTHLLAFYFATPQHFETMQPIMHAIVACSHHRNHRVVVRTFPFWRSFVARLAPQNIKNNTRGSNRRGGNAGGNASMSASNVVPLPASSTIPQQGDYNTRYVKKEACWYCS